MKVYIDDMLVKSLYVDDHLTYLAKIFNILCTYNMKLNPKKHAFVVFSRKFLGFMVNQRCIKANPDKIRAVLEIEAPWIVKEVQQLTERLASFNRFISKAANKCLPFFQILRKASKLEWTPEYEKSFA